MSHIRDIIGYATYDVSLILTDDEKIAETNLETRGVDGPTDVLSFPFAEAVKPGVLREAEFDIPDYYFLGDMIVSVEYVARRCEEDRISNEETGSTGHPEVDEHDEEFEWVDDDRGVSGTMATIYDPETRIQMLLVHGMLHLVGYDHMKDDEYEQMVKREDEVLKELQDRLGMEWGSRQLQ